MSTATVPLEGTRLMNETTSTDEALVLEWLTAAAGPHQLQRILDIPVTAYAGRTTREMLAIDPAAARGSLERVLRSTR